jgi:malonate decarboxylase alpha subunit
MMASYLRFNDSEGDSSCQTRYDAEQIAPPSRAGAALSGTSGKVCPADRATQLLEAIIEPGDRVTIEGDNQKQARFFASALAKVDPARVHDLHMVQSMAEIELAKAA